jgi:hypothetical protein
LDNFRYSAGSVASGLQFPYRGRSDPPLVGCSRRGSGYQLDQRSQDSLILTAAIALSQVGPQNSVEQKGNVL